MPNVAKAKRSSAARSVLDLGAKAARAFFFKPESYCRLDLPTYFDFRSVLRQVEKFLIGKPLASLKLKPRSCEGVNYTIYSNNDGRYAWRPFQLIHPVLYAHLVNVLTDPKAWAEVQSRFAMFAKATGGRQWACSRTAGALRARRHAAWVTVLRLALAA